VRASPLPELRPRTTSRIRAWDRLCQVGCLRPACMSIFPTRSLLSPLRRWPDNELDDPIPLCGLPCQTRHAPLLRAASLVPPRTPLMPELWAQRKELACGFRGGVPPIIQPGTWFPVELVSMHAGALPSGKPPPRFGAFGHENSQLGRMRMRCSRHRDMGSAIDSSHR
jgi:hypothetical protein